MNNPYKMTKEELIAHCRKLQAEIERLQDELDNLSDSYTELENQVADKINTLDVIDSIKDVDHFKYRLELEGMLPTPLMQFIDDYLKYYNVVKG